MHAACYKTSVIRTTDVGTAWTSLCNDTYHRYVHVSVCRDDTHTTNSEITAVIDENTAENVHVKHLL